MRIHSHRILVSIACGIGFSGGEDAQDMRFTLVTRAAVQPLSLHAWQIIEALEFTGKPSRLGEMV